MTRFNNYFANDFGSCKLIAYARDPHRGRNVRLYLMPGQVECIGVTDGVDKWIAPVIANPFSVDVVKWMRNHLDGLPNPKPVPLTETTSRQRVRLEEVQPAPVKKSAPRVLLNSTQRKPRVLLTGI